MLRNEACLTQYSRIAQLDGHEKAPADLKLLFKTYRKLTGSALLKDPNVLDLAEPQISIDGCGLHIAEQISPHRIKVANESFFTSTSQGARCKVAEDGLKTYRVDGLQGKSWLSFRDAHC